MPIWIDLEQAVFDWQSKHGRKLEWKELSEKTGIAYSTLQHIKRNEVQKVDLDKLNVICKVLECEPKDILVRMPTGDLSEEADTISLIENRLEELENLKNEKD